MPDIYTGIVGKLQGRYGKGEARALARIIVEDILHLPLPRVMAGLVSSLSAEEGQIIDDTIRRLLDDEPIQYIIGQTDFHGNTIRVNSSVLIPRPETEQLVDIALSLPDIANDAVVMDACTGSGCIAVALKTARPDWNVHACDISADALHTARENAKLNSADIAFTQCDITAISNADTTQTILAETFSLIVSNPPYIINKEKSSIEPHVLNYEPHLALFVPDNDPLVHYRAIAQWGKHSLKPSGWIAVEINPILRDQIVQLLDFFAYSHCETIKDFCGKERFLICRK